LGHISYSTKSGGRENNYPKRKRKKKKGGRSATNLFIAPGGKGGKVWGVAYVTVPKGGKKKKRRRRECARIQLNSPEKREEKGKRNVDPTSGEKKKKGEGP